MLKQILSGNLLEKNSPPVVDDPLIYINGTCNGARASFMLNESILSKHMMLIGGTGCGKTNTFFHLVKQLKSSMTEDDVMIIFDTKGDYHSKFYNSGKDCVLSASSQYKQDACTWNIFSEILADGNNASEIEPNIAEIAWGLFSESIEKNNSNPFFPNAARDLFASILTCIVRYAEGREDWISKYLHNAFLKTKLDKMNAKAIGELLKDYDDQAAVMSYIGNGENQQGLGVMAEMQSVIRKVFVGAFAEKGDFSIRNFIRNKGAKTLFIEYDLSRGATLTPIYKLLIDLALKEAMSRKCKGNVYLFCDEFKLLPYLQHIEDAVNFGRSLGVKVFAGLQSIDQLYENYGEARGKNIIAGFSSVLSFKANDEDTRNFTSGLYGKNYILEQYKALENAYAEDKRLGSVVEDWEICSLQVGEAVVGLPNTEPFKFKFDLYR